MNNKAKEMKVDYYRLKEKHKRQEIKYKDKAANLVVVTKERTDSCNKCLNCWTNLGEVKHKLEKKLKRKGS